MHPRARIAAFGSAGLLVVSGIACAVVINGGVGQYLAFALIGLGLVGVVSLVFFEVGLSEDRELAARRKAAGRGRTRPWRRKLERSRSHRRRLG